MWLVRHVVYWGCGLYALQNNFMTIWPSCWGSFYDITMCKQLLCSIGVLLVDNRYVLSQLSHLHDISLHDSIDEEPVLLQLLWGDLLRYTRGYLIVVQQVDEICGKKYLCFVKKDVRGLTWNRKRHKRQKFLPYVQTSWYSWVCLHWRVWRAERLLCPWRSYCPEPHNLPSPM